MLACFIVQINLKNYQYRQKNLKPSQSKLTIVEKLINNENTKQWQKQSLRLIYLKEENSPGDFRNNSKINEVIQVDKSVKINM